MPADGSQYLVTEQTSVTTRGDTSASNHSQTVQYNNVADTVVRNTSGNKVTQSEQSATEQETTFNSLTDTQNQFLLADKEDVSDVEQIDPGTSEVVTKSPRTLRVQFAVDFLGSTINC